jgi:hypothetical protein
MNYAEQGQDQDQTPDTAPSTNRPACDPGAVDTLACGTVGLRKQAEVATQNQTKLDLFKTQFETARADYSKARDTATTTVRMAEEQLETIRCQLQSHIDKQLQGRLQQALSTVTEKIEQCTGATTGCCVEDKTFEDGGDGTTSPGDGQGPADPADEISRLAGLIERHQWHTTKAADCFAALITEQTDLPQRATTIKTDLDALEADVVADTRHVDVQRHWARWLVADHRLRAVWQGFPSVRSYVDCLCTAFVVALRGWEAIAKLEGDKARLECEEKARQTVCARLQSDTVGEVLSEYERRWPQEEAQAQAGAAAEPGDRTPVAPTGAAVPPVDHDDAGRSARQTPAG